MKKEYQKPDVEIIDFLAEEIIANDVIDGEYGTSELPEGWE